MLEVSAVVRYIGGNAENVGRELGRVNMGKRKQSGDDDGLVVSADGRLCVSGAARSNIVKALAKLRAMPEDVTCLLSDFHSTAAAMESAIAAPVPLEVSTYYQLVASFEEAMAQSMQVLLDMAPPDDTSPEILATLHLAQARGQCFRFFAGCPGDDAKARAFLLDVSGVHTALADSVTTAAKTVLPEEGEVIASNLRLVAERIGRADPLLARGALSLATRLDAQPAMSLSTFFEHQAELNGDLGRFFLRVMFQRRAIAVEARPPSEPLNAEADLLVRGTQHAMAAAACGLLVGFFSRSSSGNNDRPRLILN